MKYIQDQTSTGARIAYALAINGQLGRTVLPNSKRLLLDAPGIYARLTMLEQHVPDILVILDEYLPVIEPHLDICMERFDDIEPYMQYIIENIEVFAPNCGPLLKHLDALLPYAKLRDEGIADDFLPYIPYFAARMDNIAPHLPALLPHVRLVPGILPAIMPFLYRYIPYVAVSANLDAVLFWWGWVLRVPVLRRILIVPGVPALINWIAPLLPRPPRPMSFASVMVERSVFEDKDICLMPGDVIMHMESVPGNARRIFAGIDIQAPVEDVWKILTDYERLENVVPNLVENTVLDRWSSGCRLRQVGSAELLPGLRFSATMTVDVETHPNGIPSDCIRPPSDYDAAASKQIQRGPPLNRGVFPSPYAIEELPIRDISMQSVQGAAGDFSHYQGVWRLRPLPGCETVDGGAAMRLTYAVELRPRICVPVKLLERRIAVDLGKNLKAIQDCAESRVQALVVPQLAGAL